MMPVGQDLTVKVIIKDVRRPMVAGGIVRSIEVRGILMIVILMTLPRRCCFLRSVEKVGCKSNLSSLIGVFRAEQSVFIELLLSSGAVETWLTMSGPRPTTHTA